MTKSSIFMVGTLALLVISNVAEATIINPRFTTESIGSFSGTPGVLLASTTQSFMSSLGASDFSGSATEAVYQDTSTGNLDFAYQFNAVQGQILGASYSSYQGYSTDVYQDTTDSFGPFTTNSVAPMSVNVSGNGSAVSSGYGYGVSAGQTTSIQLIKTNATAFGPGNASFIASGSATITNLLAPTIDPPGPPLRFAASVVPEPRYYGILALAMVLLFAAARKRRTKTS